MGALYVLRYLTVFYYSTDSAIIGVRLECCGRVVAPSEVVRGPAHDKFSSYRPRAPADPHAHDSSITSSLGG